jgi:AbrB family looped-hinge helix DNA binding protein
MAVPIPSPSDDDLIGGFAVLDDKGRLSLPKAVRSALGIAPGSAVAYLVIDGRLVVIPQDQELARLLDEAAATLERAGETEERLLARLPAARAAALRRLYGDAFADELAGAQAVQPASRGA